MASSYRCKIFSMFRVFVWFLVILFSNCSVQSLENIEINEANQTRGPTQEDLDIIRAYLMKINKPGTKTIKSPDGDIIDCVISDQQLAFDHPELKGQKPLDPPEIPPGYNNSSNDTNEVFPLWSMLGESCPDGTVPVIRTTEEDILQHGNISTFGRKPIETLATDNTHEYATVDVYGNKIYGAKAHLNVWAPKVKGKGFSLAQIWISSAGSNGEVNTIEAGWQVYPQAHRGDWQPRLFVFWTADGYKSTGCYNFQCPGFVQVSKKLAPGAALTPLSSYGGPQKGFTLLIFKDEKSGNWWLRYGDILVGYWPSVLFGNLRDYATRITYGGEVYDVGEDNGEHKSNEMGSGHFAAEEFGKAAYFRNVEVINESHNLEKPHNIKLSADHPNCYSIKSQDSKNFGYQFYYGGPGCLR